MILYNITINIDSNVKDEWMEWMKTKHIPDVMNTGKFIDCRFSKILAEEAGGFSYSIQYLSKSQADFDDYQENHAPQLQNEHNSKYAGKFGAFRTIMEVVGHFTDES